MDAANVSVFFSALVVDTKAIRNIMKVAHIFKTYFPDTQGGLEEAIRQIASYTTERGVYNKIITVSDNPTPKKLNFAEGEVVRYKNTVTMLSTPFSKEFCRNFCRDIQDCDILHYHFPWPFAEMFMLFKQIQKPSIVTYHADIVKHPWIKWGYKPLVKKFLAKMDVIIPTSKAYLDSSDELKFFKDKCQIVNLSIGKNRFPLNTDDVEMTHLEKEIEQKYGKNFFLFVGVHRHYKGLEYFIRAMKGLNANAVIIGKGKNKHELEKIASKLGLDNIFFPGFIRDRELPAYFKLCRAFVLPSIDRSEAFGVSLLEASYYSKPMVTTELSTGTTYINQHLKTGFVVPPKDIEALRKAFLMLLEDDGLCERFGSEARKRYENNFLPELTIKQYLEIYNNLISNNPH